MAQQRPLVFAPGALLLRAVQLLLLMKSSQVALGLLSENIQILLFLTLGLQPGHRSKVIQRYGSGPAPPPGHQSHRPIPVPGRRFLTIVC